MDRDIAVCVRATAQLSDCLTLNTGVALSCDTQELHTYARPSKHNNNNYYYYLLQLGCHPVAVVMLHVYKI